MPARVLQRTSGVFPIAWQLYNQLECVRVDWWHHARGSTTARLCHTVRCSNVCRRQVQRLRLASQCCISFDTWIIFAGKIRCDYSLYHPFQQTYEYLAQLKFDIDFEAHRCVPAIGCNTVTVSLLSSTHRNHTAKLYLCVPWSMPGRWIWRWTPQKSSYALSCSQLDTMQIWQTTRC